MENIKLFTDNMDEALRVVSAQLERSSQENRLINNRIAELSGIEIEEIEEETKENDLMRILAAQPLAEMYVGLITVRECLEKLFVMSKIVCVENSEYKELLLSSNKNDANILYNFQVNFFEKILMHSGLGEFINTEYAITRINDAAEVARINNTTPEEVFKDESLFQEFMRIRFSKERLRAEYEKLFDILLDGDAWFQACVLPEARLEAQKAGKELSEGDILNMRMDCIIKFSEENPDAAEYIKNTKRIMNVFISEQLRRFYP